jgi:hypothetical protein
MVNSKEDLITAILQNTSEIKAFGVIKLGIFGSFVKDKVTGDSDIDFFIEFNPEYKTLKNFVGLAHLLEHVCGRNVEIVTPQSLNKYIGKYIVQEVEYVPFAA